MKTNSSQGHARVTSCAHHVKTLTLHSRDTGAKAEAWCLLIHADASLSLSHGINIAEGGLTALVIIIFIVLVVIIVFVFSGGRQRSYSRANNGTPRRAAAAE